MATQNTTMYDNQSNVLASGIEQESRDDGKARVIKGSFTTTSAVTAGSQYIALFRLPKGARVESLEIIVPASVGTSSAKIGTFTIGADGTTLTAEDDDAYGSGKDLSSAARVQFITTAADANRTTSAEVAVVLSPVTTNFATAILFSWICRYTTGN